jgi:hypothetical protein
MWNEQSFGCREFAACDDGKAKPQALTTRPSFIENGFGSVERFGGEFHP